MRPDQERVSGLIVSTIIKLCEKGLDFSSEVKIEGVIGITVDSKEAFVVHVNKTLSASDNGYGHLNSSTSRISSSHNFQEATSSVARDGAVSVGSSSASERSQMFTPNLSQIQVKEEKSDTTFPGSSTLPLQTSNVSNTDLSATKDASASNGSLHFFSTYNMPENTSPSHFDASTSVPPCKPDVLNPAQVVSQTSSNVPFNDEDTIDMKDSMPQLKMEDYSEPRLNQIADDNIQLKPSEVIDINSDEEDIPRLQKQLPQQQAYIQQQMQPENFNISQQNQMDVAYGNNPSFFKQEMPMQYPNSQQFAPMNIQYPCPSPNVNQGFSGSISQMNSPRKPLMMASPMKQQMDPSMYAQSMAPQQQPMRMRAPAPAKRGRGSKTGGPPKVSNESLSMALVPVQRPRQVFSPSMFDPMQPQQNFHQQPRPRPNQGMRMPTSSMQARAAGFPGQQRPPTPHRGRGGSGAQLGSRGGGRGARGGGGGQAGGGGGGGGGNVMNQVVECQSGDGFSFNKQMTVLSRYSCNLCGKVYKNQRSVLHHQSQVHGRPKARRKRKKATEEEDDDEEDMNEGYDEGEEGDYGGEYYEDGDYGDEGW